MQFGSPVATALIGDRRVRLIVDSGGFSLGLRPEVVTKLGLVPSDQKTSTTNVHGNSRESRSVRIPLLKIGGDEYSDVPAYEWNMPDALVNLSPVVDGTLGRDFLNQFVAVYDYSNSVITLLESGDAIASKCEGTEVDLLNHPEGIISTDIEVDHGRFRAIWDTGATHSFVKTHIAEMRSIPLDELSGADGSYNSDTLVLGGRNFGPLNFIALPYTEPQNIDVFIGRNVFASHVVCVNPLDGWLRIRRN